MLCVLSALEGTKQPKKLLYGNPPVSDGISHGSLRGSKGRSRLADETVSTN